jgi:hypothetical protein
MRTYITLQQRIWCGLHNSLTCLDRLFLCCTLSVYILSCCGINLESNGNNKRRFSDIESQIITSEQDSSWINISSDL